MSTTCTLAPDKFALTGWLPIPRSSSKINLAICEVCVCNIWTDVKLLIEFYSICRGMERTYEAPSNEATHMILGYHQGRLVTYLQFNLFRNSKGPSSEPQPPCYTICCTVVAIWNQCWSFTISSAASEPSSVFSPNHVADSIFDFLGNISPNHVADVFGLFCQNHVADV